MAKLASGGATPAVTLKQYWLKNWQTGTPASLQTGSNPMTVTAGSTLIAVVVGYDGTRQIPIVTDSAGTFAVPSDSGSTSALIHSSTFETVYIAAQVNATGGSHTITCPTIVDGTGGTNGEIGLWIYEVTNMRSTLSVRDVGLAHNLNSTLSWSVTTDTTPVANDIIFGVGVEENSAATVNANMSNPPSGWTALNVNNDGTNFLPTTIFYKIVSSGGAQSASISTTDTNKTEDFSILLALSPT